MSILIDNINRPNSRSVNKYLGKVRPKWDTMSLGEVKKYLKVIVDVKRQNGFHVT